MHDKSNESDMFEGKTIAYYKIIYLIHVRFRCLHRHRMSCDNEDENVLVEFERKDPLPPGAESLRNRIAGWKYQLESGVKVAAEAVESPKGPTCVNSLMWKSYSLNVVRRLPAVKGWH